MKVYEKITELIGKTPLLKLSNYIKNHSLEADIYAKLEYFNPAGSVKDRIARAMIDDAEAKGLLKEGSVIIGADERQHRNRPCVSRCVTRVQSHFNDARDNER